MLYSDLITALGDLWEIPITSAGSITPSSDPSFNAIIPSLISYAELRIQRDLDLVATIVTDNSGSMVPNNRVVTLPGNGAFLVVAEVTPVVNGVRQPTLVWASREFIDSAWPSDTAPQTPSIPCFVCRRDTSTVMVAPAPDAGYGVEVVGTQRVIPLSASNPSNWVANFLPDLYFAAANVFFAGYQRDYGAQADDPKLAQSWEQQYQTLLKGSAIEEFRKKQQSVGWGNRLPSPLAQQT